MYDYDKDLIEQQKMDRLQKMLNNNNRQNMTVPFSCAFIILFVNVITALFGVYNTDCNFLYATLELFVFILFLLLFCAYPVFVCMIVLYKIIDFILDKRLKEHCLISFENSERSVSVSVFEIVSVLLILAISYFMISAIFDASIFDVFSFLRRKHIL